MIQDKISRCALSREVTGLARHVVNPGATGTPNPNLRVYDRL